tara:strand:+ start:136 stop:510 length:375 start_codon:yes stop_codon:yes gene_type:complete
MKSIINITKNAWKKMEIILKQSNNKHGFIFGATSGGCNGFNFKLELLKEDDYHIINKLKPNILENDNVKLYIDPMSEMYLLGTTIDFIDEDFSKGIFESKFTYNIDRKIASSCGCGISFRPKNI